MSHPLKKKPSPSANAPAVITSVSELVAKSAVKITVEWPPNAKKNVIRIEGRRLKPNEEGELRLLLETVLPPMLPPAPEGGEERHDLRDPEYLKRLLRAKSEARAFACYCCYPIIRDEVNGKWTKGGVPDRAFIVQTIEDIEMDGELLDLMYAQLTASVGRLVAEHANFT